MTRTFTIKPIKSKFGRVEFPVDQLLALYVRLSKGEQAEDIHESFEMQTKGLLKLALDDLRWNPVKILDPFIENQQKADGTWKNASGTKRIDDRPILKSLLAYIIRDEVKAILVWLVDRLFRDEEGAEAPAFARICKEHGVMLFTSAGEWFDFTNPRDYERFLAEANAAAEFITYNLRERAHPARKEVSRRGEYDGRSVPIGFIVEQKPYRRKFADKQPRFFLVYEEHAAIVRWIFRRYRELGGNFAALCREIEAMQYVFPFFPKGMYVPHIHLSHNEYGYTISADGLKGLLTNVAYIGWWYIAGEPVRKDNHPAIIDEGDFWYAFDRLSKFTIAGQPREPPPEWNRYNKVGTVSYEALLNGIVSSDGMPVYVVQHATKPSGAFYTITNTKTKFGNRMLGSISVGRLDRLFTEHLLEKLEEGKRLRALVAGSAVENDLDYLKDMLATHFIDAAKVQQENTAGIDAQLIEYRTEAASLEHTLHYGASVLDGKTIEKFSTRLENLHRSIEQLETKKKRAEIAVAELAEFVERLDDIPGSWDAMTVAKRRSFIKLVTEKVTLTRVAPNWLFLDITWLFFDEWHVPSRSQCYILQLQGSGDAWTEEENGILCDLYPYTDRATILQSLPRRSWSAITAQARRLELRRPYLLNNSGLHPSVSVEDDRFMRSLGVAFDEGIRAWWISDDKREETRLTTNLESWSASASLSASKRFPPRR